MFIHLLSNYKIRLFMILNTNNLIYHLKNTIIYFQRGCCSNFLLVSISEVGIGHT